MTLRASGAIGTPARFLFHPEGSPVEPMKKTRPAVQQFQTFFHYRTDRYLVSPLDPERGDGGKGFRLQKLTGDGEVYDVRLTDQGPRCNCKGFRYRGRCKHVAMLRLARMTP
jgi:hypothetical protein